MRTDLADNLFTVADLFSPDECRALIDRAEDIGFDAATVAMAAGARRVTQVRNNDRVVLEDRDLAEQLWQRAQPHLPSQIDDAAVHGLNERLRFYRYDLEQRFKGHRDGRVEYAPGVTSRLTMMVYLNDDVTGGETVFYSEDRENGLRPVVARVQPTTGTALFFVHEWWHEGADVTTGRKYVLRTDVLFKRRT